MLRRALQNEKTLLQALHLLKWGLQLLHLAACKEGVGGPIGTFARITQCVISSIKLEPKEQKLILTPFFRNFDWELLFSYHQSISKIAHFWGKGRPLAFFIQWPLEWPQYEIFAILGPPRIFLPLRSRQYGSMVEKHFLLLFKHKENSNIIMHPCYQKEDGIDLARWKGSSFLLLCVLFMYRAYSSSLCVEKHVNGLEAISAQNTVPHI